MQTLQVRRFVARGPGGIMSGLTIRRATRLLMTAVTLALVVWAWPARAQQLAAQPAGATKPAAAKPKQLPSRPASSPILTNSSNAVASSADLKGQAPTGGSAGGERRGQVSPPDGGIGGKSQTGKDKDPSGDKDKEPGNKMFVLLLVYVGLLFTLPFGLHLNDSVQAYRFSKQTRDKLIDKLDNKLSADQGVRLMRELAELATSAGIPGTTRSIYTYTLLVVLGIAVFHLLAVSSDESAGQYADKILTVLAGTVSSLIGFYFGSKATKEAAESGGARQAEEPTGPSGKITNVVPNEAKAGQEVKIEGTGFGNQGGNVKFGEISADKVEDWKENSIRVKVPQSATVGSTVITVNPPQGAEIVGSPTLFKVLAP